MGTTFCQIPPFTLAARVKGGIGQNVVGYPRVEACQRKECKGPFGGEWLNI